MTIRYVREGLKLVRVTVEAPLPRAEPQSHPSAADPRSDEDARRTFHVWAEGIRTSTARARLAAGAVTGEHVRVARRLVRIGQRDLADHLQLARASIGDAETGRRRVHPKLAAWATTVLREHSGWEPPKC